MAFALDCCGYEVMRHVATMGGIIAEDVQALTVATDKHRCEQSDRAPKPIKWLTDNDSCHTSPKNMLTRLYAPSTAIISVNPRPDAQSVIDHLSGRSLFITKCI